VKILVRQGRVIDPAQGIDKVMDILIEDGRIAGLGVSVDSFGCDAVIDASAKVVMPGLVDMHVHLRQPGRQDKETVASGTEAALWGGVTSVLAMPNTEPAIDSLEAVRQLKGIIEKTASSHVFICAAITKGRKGQELVDIRRLKEEGVVAISDDGASVDNAFLLEEAMLLAKEVSLPVICHCEDTSLSGKGVVNRGFVATRLGLRGIPRESEYLRVERDVALAEKTGVSLHICHLSCRESVEIVAQAKKRGVKVTCEVTPHHLFFTEEDCLGYDTNMKVNPPLRRRDDQQVLKEALCQGVIDVVASDHAPHTENEKDIEFDRAEFGALGLQTGLSAVFTVLVEPGLLDWPGLVKRMSLFPAQILGLDKGTLRVSSCADITIFDPNVTWLVKKEDLVSKSKNSPFIGRRLKGKVTHTICAGRINSFYEVSADPRIRKIE